MSRIFGEIANYPEGNEFVNRKELSKAGIHRPMQAGISGSANEGADSIVLSGGYEDDLDYGVVIIYTGHGGRDEVSGKQNSNQELVRQNLALAISRKNNQPVRVVRGSKHFSPYSPKFGYRYDGLYFVTDHWREKGSSNYFVWRFKLEKFNVLPNVGEKILDENAKNYFSHILRNRTIANYLKKLHSHKCQICCETIETPAGFYSESAHIIPLGNPHHGKDINENILILCPNCHVRLDFGSIGIDDDFSLINLHGFLNVHSKHAISRESLSHHRIRFNLNGTQ